MRYVIKWTAFDVFRSKEQITKHMMGLAYVTISTLLISWMLMLKRWRRQPLEKLESTMLEREKVGRKEMLQ